MSEHDWFSEHLDLYGVGALSADECQRLERHAAGCGACAQELARRRLLDQGLERLCAPVHFAADWDQRVQARWQVTHRPPRRWSAPARWAMAAAAMIMVGVLGSAVNAVAQMGFVGFPGGEVVQADVNLPNVLPVFAMGEEGRSWFAERVEEATARSETAIRAHSSNNLKQLGGIVHGQHDSDGELKELSKFKISQEGWTDDFDRFSLAFQARAGDGTHTSVAGGVMGGKKVQPPPPTSGSGAGATYARETGIANGAVSGLTPSGTLTPDLNVPTKGSTYEFGYDFGVRMLYDQAGGGQVPDGGSVALGGITQRLDKLEKHLTDGLSASVQNSDGSVRNFGLDNGRGWKYGKEDGKSKDILVDAKETHTGSLLLGVDGGRRTGASKQTVVGNNFSTSNDKSSERLESTLKSVADLEKAKPGEPKATSELHKLSTGYYILSGGKKYETSSLPSGGSAPSSPAKDLSKLQKMAGAAGAREDAKAEEAFLKALDNGLGKQVALQNPAAIQQPKPAPQVAERKIIRTGEMEFEVSGFDDTVAQVQKLIGAVPGAFVMTVNSDKLPNGKVKGAVVVRVPPEHLDKFVLDLRKELGKTGELKTQRIGAQDVTKQYTDIESRLRAARIMEERLLSIIKTGKGEVKDLIAAERELGVWRTKIEEMEGEIRFYNNQVGLSTLTINVVEKEIRAAASMVITEQVTMKIEADDVEKGLQTALAAVTEAKGRVTKSDLKQHAAGQLEAILQFEVAPAAAGPVKTQLKKLGIVTHHDAQRLQQAEGGPAPALDKIKSRTNDVQFSVTLYNVANIKPRQEFVLQVAVPEVAPEYHRLLELVLQASGQVRVSQLNEQDKNNMHAQLDFDVPTTKRELFDLQLAGLGETVSKSTTRAGPGETATDRKIGYRLTLKSVNSITPRETFAVLAYSLDVPAAFKKLQDAVAAAKGHVRAGQVNEQDKNNVTAQFDFDVPTAEQAKLDKLLDEIGEVHSRTTNRVQPGEVATDRKVGYRLSVRGLVPPRETLDLVLEVRSVKKSAADFESLVTSAKGKVFGAKVTEDAAGRATGTQLFIVPLDAMKGLVQNFEQGNQVRGRDATQNLQAPAGKLATAQIAVRLTNPSPIVPGDEGLFAQIRTSLAYAVRLLSVSLMFVIVGISVILPWALLLWVGVKLFRRTRAKGQAPA